MSDNGLFDRNRLIANLFGWYSMATPAEKLEGSMWYENAKIQAGELAKKYGQPVEVVAALMAILSPCTLWEKTLECTESMLKAKEQKKKCPSTTTYRRQEQKAWSLLSKRNDTKNFSKEDFLSYIGSERALKTRAFYENILNPDSSNAVIDSWMGIAACVGKKTYSKKQYKAIQGAVVTIARHVNVRAADVQAIIWCVVRGYCASKEYADGLRF